MSDNRFPAPSTVSENARAWLEFRAPAMPYPPKDDIDAWVAMVDERNAFIAKQFLGHDLPVTIEDRSLGDLPFYVVRPHDGEASSEGIVYFNLHGGGLLLGGGEACRAMTSMAALATGLETWGVDYRMPPRHPFPAALDDAMTAYRSLLESHDPDRVVVGGGSAGGNLAAALMLRCKDEGVALPAALILNTPEVDLTESGDTFTVLEGVDNVLSSLAVVNDLYASGAELDDPYLSPLYGNVAGFPPTYLQSGTRDLFLSNTVRMHRKLLAAGVEAELHVFEAMPHGGFGGGTPEDADHAASQRAFVARHL